MLKYPRNWATVCELREKHRYTRKAISLIIGRSIERVRQVYARGCQIRRKRFERHKKAVLKLVK